MGKSPVMGARGERGGFLPHVSRTPIRPGPAREKKASNDKEHRHEQVP